MFSAISLIMIAYTTRFVTYTQVIRSMAAEWNRTRAEKYLLQIGNLRRRLYLIRAMQVLGIVSLLLCVICTLLIYLGAPAVASWLFVTALATMSVSLAVAIAEIVISVRALEIHIEGMEQPK